MGSANVFQASFRRLSGVFQASLHVNLAAAQFWQALVWGGTVRSPKKKVARSVILSTGNGLVLEGLQNLVF